MSLEVEMAVIIMVTSSRSDVVGIPFCGETSRLWRGRKRRIEQSQRRGGGEGFTGQLETVELKISQPRLRIRLRYRANSETTPEKNDFECNSARDHN